jgi:hypothetical protein
MASSIDVRDPGKREFLVHLSRRMWMQKNKLLTSSKIRRVSC